MNVYKIDELDESVKMVVIDRFRVQEQELRDIDLSCYLDDILVNDYNLKDFNIDYSLSYSQGDGVCFYNGGINALSYTILKNGDYNNANAFEKYIIDNYNGNEFEAILNYLNEGNSIYIEKTFFQYSHLNTCSINYDWEVDSQNIDNWIIEDLCNELKIYVYNPICEKLEKLGYDFMEVSDEDVIEFIEANEYEFYKDGSIYREEF